MGDVNLPDGGSADDFGAGGIVEGAAAGTTL